MDIPIIYFCNPLSVKLKKNFGCVYLYENILGNTYIGQCKSRSGMKSRHNAHLSSHDTLFDTALDYDPKPPTKILEYCHVSSINDCEVQWIKKYYSVFPKGWNMTDVVYNTYIYVYSEDYAMRVSSNSKKYWSTKTREERLDLTKNLVDGAKKWYASLSDSEKNIMREKNRERGINRWNNYSDERKEEIRTQLRRDASVWISKESSKKLISERTKEWWKNLSNDGKRKFGEKISQAVKGVPKSEKHCQSLSESHMGKICRNTKEIFFIKCNDDSTEIMIFESQREASRVLNEDYRKIYTWVKKGRGFGGVWGYTGKVIPPRI